MKRVYSNIQMLQFWMLMLYLRYLQEYSTNIYLYIFPRISNELYL